MDWKKEASGSFWKMNKEKLIFLFCSGLLMVVLSMPGKEPGTAVAAGAGGSSAGGRKDTEAGEWADTAPGSYSGQGGGETFGENGQEVLLSSASGGDSGYARELEKRIAAILGNVEGVGKAEVMVVLKSSEEKVIHVDKNSRISATGENGDSGRSVKEQEISENTVMGGENKTPIVKKELTPELSGIVISADGGGNATVKAEISGAMEALFGLPAHKIKVLKRVKEGV